MMSRLKRRALATTSILFVFGLNAACDGDSSSSSGGGTPIIIQATTSATPAEFSLADSSCQDEQKSADITLESTEVYAWDDESTHSLPVTLSGIKSSNSLHSNLVKITTYGEKLSRICNYKKKDRACLDGNDRWLPWTIDAEARNLRICKTRGTYPRKSHEATALTSIYYLEHAFNRYNELDAKEHPLKQIELSVLPLYTEFYDNYPYNGKLYRLETYYTHNLAYFLKPAGITVFPEDIEEEKLADGYLWESSFVLAHEFGHHIDIDLHGDDIQSMGLEWNPLLHRYDDLLLTSRGVLAANNGRAEISGSVSEGTADLLAYYSLGGNSDSLVGLHCFGKSRDISRATFGNGEAKILTEDRLSLLLGSTQEKSQRTCDGVSYADIHTGGAIIAYTLDQAFSQLTAFVTEFEPGSATDFDTRYKLTLQWLAAYRDQSKELNLNSSSADILSPLSQALEIVANSWLSGATLRPDAQRQNADIQSEVCRIFAEHLPVVPRAPFALRDSGSVCE